MCNTASLSQAFKKWLRKLRARRWPAWSPESDEKEPVEEPIKRMEPDPQAACHPCLHIPEILLLIFGELDRRTLARVALTCQMFNGPAVDMLYARAEHFVEILERLPWDLWVLQSPRYEASRAAAAAAAFDDTQQSHALSRSNCYDWKMAFCRDMRAKDWDILLNRASKLRTYDCFHDSGLILGDIRRPFIAESVIKALTEWPDQRSSRIFPNLQTLRLNGPGFEDLRPFCHVLFPSPNLRVLDLSPQVASVMLEHATLLQGNPFPVLETFMIRGCSSFHQALSASSIAGIARILRQSRNLCHVSGMPVDDTGLLSHLSTLPRLEMIDLLISSELRNKAEQEIETRAVKMYQNLTSLKITTGDLRNGTRALQALLSPESTNGRSHDAGTQRHRQRGVERFTLDASGSSDPDTLPHFTAALAQHTLHSNLRELVLIMTWPDMRAPISLRTMHENLRPLTPFFQLTTLDVRWSYAPPGFQSQSTEDECGLSSQHILELASCWPLLTDLRLSPLSRPLSLLQLFALLDVCPRLSSIRLNVRVSLADTLLVNSKGITRSSRFEAVKTLMMTHTSPTTLAIDPLARLLARATPNLSNVELGGRYHARAKFQEYHFWKNVLLRKHAEADRNRHERSGRDS